MTTVTTPLAMPRLHINGTGARMLLEGYVEASLAVGAAIDAMSRVEFNGRDYYMQPDHVWAQAVNEHAARFKRLQDVKAELDAISEHVADTGHKPGSNWKEGA